MQAYLDMLAGFIAKVGFPVFVAVLLLWREDTRHSENIQAMSELVHAIKDQHLAIHCRQVAERLNRAGRPRRPRNRRR